MLEHRLRDRTEAADLEQEIIDLGVVIETPENVVLTYRLAGPAVRVGAYLLDLMVRIGIMVAGAIVLGCAGAAALPGLSAGVFLLLWFFIEWGYYVVSEGFFRGKTIGKNVFHLRVIQEGGYPITLWAALLRNFVRAADCLPLFLYGVGFLTMLASGKFRRLGDLAARTLVIQEDFVPLPLEPIILERIHPLPHGEISGYIPKARTMSLIEQFLGRRHVLTHRRGHAMALVLARALARRLDYRGDMKQVEQYPMAFLARVYATFHERPEEEEVPESTAAQLRPVRT